MGAGWSCGLPVERNGIAAGNAPLGARDHGVVVIVVRIARFGLRPGSMSPRPELLGPAPVGGLQVPCATSGPGGQLRVDPPLEVIVGAVLRVPGGEDRGTQTLDMSARISGHRTEIVRRHDALLATRHRGTGLRGR